MQIEQALYGEKGGGHSLLDSSGDETVSTALVQHLDLPDTAPPGAEWSPFLRGFPYQDRYVLSRTFHDKAASRGGMVFSHALLAPLDELVQTPDLRPLLQLLATSSRQRPDATTVRLSCSKKSVPQAIDLVDATEALVATGKLPVIRLDHIGFDDLVVSLWVYLPTEIRRSFSFRMSFGPADLIEQPKPALVCTPRGMAARWSGYPIIRAVTPHEPESLAAAILSGRAAATPLIEFMHQLEVRPATFPDLRLAEQAYLLDISDPTLEQRAGVMRLIEKLSPDSGAGCAGKILLVERLCDALSGAKAEEILRLRNLQLSAFPESMQVWNALAKWVVENGCDPDQDTEILSVLESATTTGAAVEDWQTAILNGLANAARSTNSNFPRAFWRWIKIRSEITTTVFPYVPIEAAVEERLARAMPRIIDKSAAATLETLALSRGWILLHGTILSASSSPLDAARRHVVVDTNPSFLEGMRAALRRAKPADLVECALEIEDPRMTQLAAEAVVKDPKLLAGVDLTPSAAQTIWRKALTIDLKSWQGPTDPEAAFHSILDHLLDDGQVDRMLLERLSDTPLADLGGYPRRSEIWSRIGGSAQHKMLTETANNWLKNAVGGHVPATPEQDLETAILESSELERALNTLIPSHAGRAVRIVVALSHYDQQRFRQLLTTLMTQTNALTTTDAESIGRLVWQRRWEDVAAYLLDHFKSGRQDLKPALCACSPMINLIDKLVYSLEPVSESEKWEALQKLAADLYPSGPDEGGLWERAGGKNADISTGSNGRTRWRDTLKNMRNGKGPLPLVLLSRMMEDYPNNEQISHLVSDPVFAENVTNDLETT
ncbi:MAG: effector-associated domain EAD1-containing protein [Gammaproteobacteria bacterium]|nr:effector-associated domain EAD1-containing protein [Gammaproteobacteria bacterium]